MMDTVAAILFYIKNGAPPPPTAAEVPDAEIDLEAGDAGELVDDPDAALAPYANRHQVCMVKSFGGGFEQKVTFSYHPGDENPNKSAWVVLQEIGEYCCGSVEEVKLFVYEVDNYGIHSLEEATCLLDIFRKSPECITMYRGPSKLKSIRQLGFLKDFIHQLFTTPGSWMLRTTLFALAK
jgi:hypothetical protein